MLGDFDPCAVPRFETTARLAGSVVFARWLAMAPLPVRGVDHPIPAMPPPLALSLFPHVPDQGIIK